MGGGINLYAYASDDPINHWDATGKKDLLICFQLVPYGNFEELALCLLAGSPYRGPTPDPCDQAWFDAVDAAIKRGADWETALAEGNAAEDACRKNQGQPTPQNSCDPLPIPIPEIPPFEIPFMIP
jgi:hypothetical protein